MNRDHDDDPAGAPTPIDALEALFEGAGAEQYLGEEVTQAQHMLQAAALAEAADAPAALVAAALLHDIGHFQGTVSGAQWLSGTDNRHSQVGADRLAAWFGPAVTEPVRLHVPAKRYLCAVEPAYAGTLSAESIRTLAVQGGPMSAAEVRAYEAGPYALDAVAVRRWDDLAKDPVAVVAGFAHYRTLLAALMAEHAARAAATGR
ncbi:HD domain-containing protein [Actinacidiphila alni]|uniref:HD domain-containing protein n=1 Tax=Actinacidiphila alni TaxID=380248 RepID=UPI0033CB26AD